VATSSAFSGSDKLMGNALYAHRKDARRLDRPLRTVRLISGSKSCLHPASAIRSSRPHRDTGRPRKRFRTQSRSCGKRLGECSPAYPQSRRVALAAGIEVHATIVYQLLCMDPASAGVGSRGRTLSKSVCEVCGPSLSFANTASWAANDTQFSTFHRRSSSSITSQSVPSRTAPSHGSQDRRSMFACRKRESVRMQAGR
jgi:hypothetical protein